MHIFLRCSLPELLLTDVAGDKSAAVLIDAVGEVLTGHAGTGSVQALQLLLIDQFPLLLPRR